MFHQVRVREPLQTTALDFAAVREKQFFIAFRSANV